MQTRIIFLCSGDGGNLRFIAEAIRLGWISNAQICCVLTDRQCRASEFARLLDIETRVVDFGLQGQHQLVDDLRNLEPHLIVTTVHKILIPNLVTAFQGKLINLHYSLLPSFAGVIGKRPIQEALKYGSKIVGTTVHVVSEAVDTGQPIVQSAIAVRQGDDEDMLMDIVFRSGCISLLNAIQGFTQEDGSARTGTTEFLTIKNRTSIYSPAVEIHEELFMDSFWEKIKNL